jgi:hypothetical protein
MQTAAPCAVRRPRAHGTAVVLALALAAAALAGCGASNRSAAGGPDPAGAVPASAALYFGADVRPQGSEKDAALSVGRALTHQADPYLRLLSILQTPGSAPLDFHRDVAPWLGGRGALFVSSLSSAGPLTGLVAQALQGGSPASAGAYPFGSTGAQGAILLDTSDRGKAEAFLRKQARAAGAHAGAYRGVAYETTASGLAFGLVHGFAVIGSETGLHGVVDTVLGGPALAASSSYRTLTAKAPAGTLAHLYAAATPRPGAGVPLVAGGAPTNVSLVPATHSLALDIDTLSAATSGLLGSDPEGASALDRLPADSWLAIGLGHVGATLGQDVARLKELASLAGAGGSGGGSSGASALNLGSLLNAMLAPLEVLGAPNAQARHAFSSWMGSGGVFAGGGSLLELRAAVTITSKEPSRSRAAVAALADQLRRNGAHVRPVSIPGTDAAVGVSLSGLPVVLDIADGASSSGQTEFVLGFGEASVTAALHPSATLAGASTRSSAASSLGEGIQPSLILDVPTLLGLLEGVGLTEEPSLAKALPYLRSLGTLAGGGRSLGGGIQRYRLLVALGRGEG